MPGDANLARVGVDFVAGQLGFDFVEDRVAAAAAGWPGFAGGRERPQRLVEVTNIY